MTAELWVGGGWSNRAIVMSWADEPAAWRMAERIRHGMVVERLRQVEAVNLERHGRQNSEK